MGILSVILQELKSICNPYCILLIIAVGLFTFFVDRKRLEKDNKKKDAKIAKFVGVLYIALGPALFIITQFI